MHFLEVDGLSIAYERRGQGPLLVLLHGAADDSRGWRPQLDDLADEFTVVAWDEPGAGRSADVPEHFGLVDYADCLAALVETLALGPAHVAGLSWGGVVALELYRGRPDLVASLILLDTYAGWRGSLPDAEVRARVAAIEDQLATGTRTVDLALPGLFAGSPPAGLVPMLTAVAAEVRPATLRHQLLLMAEADLRDLLPDVAVPTLLVWGELDTRSPLGVAHQLAESIPDAELVVIAGAGHLSNLERPEQVNRAVRRFCRRHAATTDPRAAGH